MPGPASLRIILLALALGGLLSGVPAQVLARDDPCPGRDEVTVRDLLDLAPMRVAGYWGENPRAHACFGSRTITIHGYANWPEGLGGTSTSGVKPAYFEWPRFFLFATSREVAPGYGRGPFYGIVVPPRLGAVENRYHRAWVVITARFADPLANRCRGYGPANDRPTRAEAIASCRNRLVMVSIARLPGPPSTDATVSAAMPAAPGAPPAVPPPAPPVIALVAIAGAVAGWRQAARQARTEAAPHRGPVQLG